MDNLIFGINHIYLCGPFKKKKLWPLYPQSGNTAFIFTRVLELQPQRFVNEPRSHALYRRARPMATEERELATPPLRQRAASSGSDSCYVTARTFKLTVYIVLSRRKRGRLRDRRVNKRCHVCTNLLIWLTTALSLAHIANGMLTLRRHVLGTAAEVYSSARRCWQNSIKAPLNSKIKQHVICKSDYNNDFIIIKVCSTLYLNLHKPVFTLAKKTEM